MRNEDVIPPGDLPLVDGLGSEWNDIVGALPEDRRSELAPKLKERLDAYEPLKQYEDFYKSGVSKEQVSTALDLFQVIENNPRQVYEAIGKHLGITTQQAQQVVEQVQDSGSSDNDDDEFDTLRNKVDTLAQITLAKQQQEVAAREAAEADAAIERELNALKKKVGDDFDEEEILMRMLHKNVSAEQAYNEYTKKVEALRARRPAPAIIGSGGSVPRNAIDPTKLDSAGTKNLVAQMLQHASDVAKS